MQVVEQAVNILNVPLGGTSIIERAGRTCYKSEDAIGCTRGCKTQDDCFDMRVGYNASCVNVQCPEHSSNKFVKMIMKRGHETVIEHVGMTVHFLTDRGVTHELVRHRLAVYSQESTRYVNYTKKKTGTGGIQFVCPIVFGRHMLGKQTADDITSGKFSKIERRWVSACHHDERAYNALIEHGWPPEWARSVLPNSLKTEITMTANLREWRHVFKLRAIGTSGPPHPQIQMLMAPLLLEAASQFPGIFDDLVEQLEEKAVITKAAGKGWQIAPVGHLDLLEEMEVEYEPQG